MFYVILVLKLKKLKSSNGLVEGGEARVKRTSLSKFLKPTPMKPRKDDCSGGLVQLDPASSL